MSADLSLLGMAAAFAAGLVSFLSPCVLPLVPGYVSFIAGNRAILDSQTAGRGDRLAALWHASFFVLGFSCVFIALGASATAIGQVLLQQRDVLNIAGGIVIMLFGLLLTGILRLPGFGREFRWHLQDLGGTPASAFLLGLCFAFGWTPCIGPILGSILAASASSSRLGEGVALLAVYSLGLGVPFLLAALFTDRLMHRRAGLGRLGRRLQVAAGLVLIAMGLAMATDMLSQVAYALLEALPFLALIG